MDKYKDIIIEQYRKLDGSQVFIHSDVYKADEADTRIQELEEENVWLYGVLEKIIKEIDIDLPLDAGTVGSIWIDNASRILNNIDIIATDALNKYKEEKNG